MKLKYNPPYSEPTPRGFRTFRNLHFPTRVMPRSALPVEMAAYHRLYVNRKPDKQMDETLTTGCVRRLGEEMGEIDEPITDGEVELLQHGGGTVYTNYLPFNRAYTTAQDLCDEYDWVYMDRKVSKIASLAWAKVVARLNWKEIDDPFEGER